MKLKMIFCYQNCSDQKSKKIYIGYIFNCVLLYQRHLTAGLLYNDFGPATKAVKNKFELDQKSSLSNLNYFSIIKYKLIGGKEK